MAITNCEVKQLLEQPAQDFLSCCTVALNITRSEAYIDIVKRTGVTAVNEDHAGRAMSVWLTYGSYVEGMSQQLGAQGISEVKTKLEHYRTVAQTFINLISASAISLDSDMVLNMAIGVPPEISGLSDSEGYNDA